tara:strand:+ start:74 stop:253 length:180 start_codon:yes stop_codon:yes gene_type:complete
MEIKDAQYIKENAKAENGAIRATINGILSVVPLDNSNADYIEILKQVEEKKLTIKDADE